MTEVLLNEQQHNFHQETEDKKTAFQGLLALFIWTD